MKNFAQKGNAVIIIAMVAIILLLAGALIYYFWQTSQKSSSSATPASSPSFASLAEDEIERTTAPEQKEGPYFHQIYSATSQDGLTWEKQEKLLFDHASVPGAVIQNKVIYLYFVDASFQQDRLSVAMSSDFGKTYQKHKVKIAGVAGNDAVDPHPVVIDGKIRLYYLGDFSSLPSQGKNAQAKIYLAESENGINFSGPQVAFQANAAVTDPDVFSFDQDWRMFISQGKRVKLAISQDKGLNFTQEKSFSWDKGGVCDTLKIGDVYRTYYCGQGIASATGAETGVLTPEKGVRISADSQQIVCDPSVIKLPDNSYLMYYKTQIVSDNMQKPAPGENQPPN